MNIVHIAVAGASGKQSALIDYAQDLPAKFAALRSAYAAIEDPERAALQTYLDHGGRALELFATHQALSDKFGPYWNEWPAAFQRCCSAEVREFAEGHPDDLAFHAWAQFKAESQLGAVREAAADAGMAQGLYLDLAVGTHPHGAETWSEPESFARGVSLGAPPDAFSPGGQTWGLAPLNPLTLAETGFRALARTLREQFRFARLLRIDHILGFDRAFWVPETDAVPGAYIRMPRAAMLAVARIEADRAGAAIVGEDLGNVPDGLRGDLDAAGILGCRVAMFERAHGEALRFRDAGAYDRNVLAAFSTHDLPTWEGWRQGRDLEWWQTLGRMSPEDARAARAQRRAEVSAFEACIEGSDVDSLHRFLGNSASHLVALQGEDILGLSEQANLPGTVYDHPNWRRRLPVSARSLGDDPRVRAAAHAVGRKGQDSERTST